MVSCGCRRQGRFERAKGPSLTTRSVPSDALSRCQKGRDLGTLAQLTVMESLGEGVHQRQTRLAPPILVFCLRARTDGTVMVHQKVMRCLTQLTTRVSTLWGPGHRGSTVAGRCRGQVSRPGVADFQEPCWLDSVQKYGIPLVEFGECKDEAMMSRSHKRIEAGF